MICTLLYEDKSIEKLIVGRHLDGRETVVVGDEPGAVVGPVALEFLEGELTVDVADRRAAVVGLYGAVYNDYIALIHIGIDHRCTTNAKEEC